MSLQLGKYIDSILTSQTDIWLRQRIGKRVFPVVCPAEVPALPYIVHNEGIDSVDWTQDGATGDTCTVLVDVVSTDFSMMYDIADHVRDLFAATPTYAATGLTVDSCRFVRAGMVQYIEDMDAFSLQLNFTITTIN